MRLLLTLLALLLSTSAYAVDVKGVLQDSQADKDAIYIRVYNSEGAPMFNGNVVMYGRGATADGRSVVFAPQTGDGPIAGVVADPLGLIVTQSWGRVQVWGFNDAVSVEGAATIAVSNGVALVAVGRAGTRGSSQNVDMVDVNSGTGVTRSLGGVFGISLETIATNGQGKVFINVLGN